MPKGFKLVNDFLSKEEIEELENGTSVMEPATIITGGNESETFEESITRIKSLLLIPKIRSILQNYPRR